MAESPSRLKNSSSKSTRSICAQLPLGTSMGTLVRGILTPGLARPLGGTSLGLSRPPSNVSATNTNPWLPSHVDMECNPSRTTVHQSLLPEKETTKHEHIGDPQRAEYPPTASGIPRMHSVQTLQIGSCQRRESEQFSQDERKYTKQRHCQGHNAKGLVESAPWIRID